jgi:thymidylate synthase
MDKNSWPRYYRERLWVGNAGKGYVGIATLWNAKEQITEKISEDLRSKILAVGQLYTARGVEFIIRNSWLNPRLRYLIIWGADLGKSGEFLLQDKEAILTKLSESAGEIPEEEVRKWLKAVEIIDMRGEGVEKVLERAAGLEFREPYSTEEKSFGEAKPVSQSFPSEISGIRLEGATVGEVWLQILGVVLRFGKEVERVHVYGGKEKTLLNVVSVVKNEEISDPKMWPFFTFSKDDLKNYFKNFFSPERGEEPYTYGERLFAYEWEGIKVDQVSQMAKKLKSFPYNKGAVAVLWQPGIDNFGVRKPWRTPCLTLVQGFCVEGKLFLTAYFRSNDMFGAWPQNAFALRKLQTELAKKVGMGVGDLTIISHSAFIDGNDLAAAEKIAEANKRMFCAQDPRGYLTVEVEGEEIVVKHFGNEGRFLGEYRVDGKEKDAALRLQEKLLADWVISRVDHALDIGEQLGRAEDAVKLGYQFVQDRELKVK